MALTFAYGEDVRPGYALFDDVSFKFYESLLDEIGDGNTRVTFDRGRMEVMSPLGKHERYKKRFAMLLETMMVDLQIPFACYGSTTFKSEELQFGLEPDECYYIEHEALVREKDRFDLNIDPPPDLVLEMDITHRAVDREAIYVTMGVPEIWRFDGDKFECLLLDGNSGYAVSEKSRSFPFLKPHDLIQFVRTTPDRSSVEIVRAFREWLLALPK